MGATESKPQALFAGGENSGERDLIKPVLLAALALPGLAPAAAKADTAPLHATFAYKELHYQDFQTGLRRITVDAPSIYVLTPLGQSWSLQGSAVLDVVSGASPRYYTSISGASKMHDRRVGEDGRATYYRPRSNYSLALSHSVEHDYESYAASGEASFSTEDNNTTFNVGASVSADTINPVNHIVINAHKTTKDVIAGVTQALSADDLMQVQFSFSQGKGYFNDPYKLFDNRPRHRNEATAVLRWNHQFEGLDATLRTNYRYYRDTFGVRAHTLQAEWVQPLGRTFTAAPSLTYYTQNSASFYYDPPNGDQSRFPSIPPGAYSTLDQRLSAFGGATGGLSLDWKPTPHWSVDLKGDYHEERAAWRLLGQGSPGLYPFHYVAIEFGIAYNF